ASKFRRYGAPMTDLIQEAGLGLMKAAEKFDPDRGVRFSTYAVWWIKASIQDYVMRNWSMVRTGSTSSQKSLFFNLKRVEAQIMRESGETLDSHQVTEKIATEIGVSVRDVEMMQGRLSGGDFSLNAQQGGDEDGREWIDVLEDETMQGSEQVDEARDSEVLKTWLEEAMDGLNDREKLIVRQRRLSEKGRTLEVIGAELGISKERVRQLEVAALAKMRAKLERHGAEVRALIA
ncbi:RNA polymerase factor sigma-32, partial [Cognatishimia sp.]|uniref:RNA polymerase factor sigma-32 n=1 Tax=Cognatishimia sp. TaxID=2211648 RepID=UPI00351320E3